MSRQSIHWVLALAASCFTVSLGVVAGQAVRPFPAGVPLDASPAAHEPAAAPGRQSGQPPRGAAPGDPAAAQAAYVGEDTCLTCHADAARGYHDSAHGRAANPRAPMAQQGCESCHGPGGQHVEDPSSHPVLRFTAVEPEIASEACLTCHRRGEHALWEGSAHEARNMSCSTCHSIHSAQSGRIRPGSRAAGVGALTTSGGSESAAGGLAAQAQGGHAQLVAATEMELCAQCHRPQVVKLDRSGHMPVREGKMTCSTCHNPHGATNERNLRHGTTPSEACATCHADKRGPFLWEHAPVTESCATCHDPHGSANERMLVAKLPMLCQRCHIHTRHPSTIYDASLMGTSNRLYGRSCVSCHSNIHGSNHASGNMFVR